MRADRTFVNMKDVDIADQGPDTGNNDMAVQRGRDGEGQGEAGEDGVSEGGGGSHKTWRPVSLFQREGSERLHICIILRVSNFQHVPYSLLNRAPNQWRFRCCTRTLTFPLSGLCTCQSEQALREGGKEERGGQIPAETER